MPGSEFFEAMMQFAASTAGFRGRWWREMADAARYARKDYMCRDPYCDPCPPRWSYSDPCDPDPSYCDPCPPPWSYCDPCSQPYERRGFHEEPDLINIKELRTTLENATKFKLAPKYAELEELKKKDPGTLTSAQKLEIEELEKKLPYLAAKAEAANDAVIHDVKLARVAEAMRRKQWSRGSHHGRGY
ncbi:MAG: hypothetical protein ACRD36_04815 [Candidatus Acidiferrum sp.]